MSMYSNRLQPALQNLLQHVVRFFHPRSSCTTTHISADVQRIPLNASCMTIQTRRTKQLHIVCRVTGSTSDFLSFILSWKLFGSFTEPFNCSTIKTAAIRNKWVCNTKRRQWKQKTQHYRSTLQIYWQPAEQPNYSGNWSDSWNRTKLDDKIFGTHTHTQKHTVTLF